MNLPHVQSTHQGGLSLNIGVPLNSALGTSKAFAGRTYVHMKDVWNSGSNPLSAVKRGARHCVKILTERVMTAINWLISKIARGGHLPEVAAFFLHASLYPFNLQNLESEREATKRVVLLVHGFLDRSSGWSYLYESLEKEGIHHVFSVNLGHPFHSIEHYADVLDAKIRAVKESTGCEEVVLIGHSMGGLVSRQFRQQKAAEAAVKVPLIITLGTPLAGSPVAWLASWISRPAEQMLPGSSFLQGQEDWFQENDDDTQYVHVASNSDIMVPEAYASNGHEPKQETYVVRGHGHMALQMSDEVNRIIIPKIQALDASSTLA